MLTVFRQRFGPPDEQWVCLCQGCEDMSEEGSCHEIGYGSSPMNAALDYAEKCCVDPERVIHMGEKHV
jgi:hypothetical protein